MTTESLAIWSASLVLVLAIVVPYVVVFQRRARRDHARKEEAVRLGVDKPKAQFPGIDATRCIGCGTCVAACPEGDVLGVVGGTATIVNGLRCVGHGRCEEACPVGAIQVGLGDLRSRSDIPVMDEWNETTVPGLFLAGEIGGMALVRNAVLQATRVVERIAQLAASGQRPRGSADVYDVAIVGAGPAGLTAAAAAHTHGLSHVVLEQEGSLGGTIFHYPRRKLVLVQAMDLPLLGRLEAGEYSKERLLEILNALSERAALCVRFGEKVTSVAAENELFTIRAAAAAYRSRFVILALGRRGTPRKLGVPGEEQPKVMYQLVDAESYAGQRILVVGGGDSAAEAALGLSLSRRNQVALSYRRPKLVRLKRRNEDRIAASFSSGAVEPILGSEVEAILPDRVRLKVGPEVIERENDFVLVFAGGEPPFAFLREAGVRFGGDPAA